MRRLVLLVLAAVLLHAAPALARVRCERRAGSTLVADASRRVYATVHGVKGDPDADTTRLFVCRQGSRRRSRRLETFHNTLDGTVNPEYGRIAGRWALVEFDAETGVTAGRSLGLYDLRTGKQGGSLYVDGADLLDTALTTRGAYAVNLGDRGLLAFDAAGQRTLAPNGATDLAARGHRVYWTVGGAAATAVLGATPTKDVDIE
jgi:hypothetical protein